MALTFFNSLSGTKERFASLRPPTVSFYTCGPTVYAPPHIGNLRTFVTSDLLRRTLERFGLTVRQVINITDVDDKTIAGAAAAGLSLVDFTRRYEQMFLDDLDALNVLRPAALPRATEFIDQMIVLIKKMLERGIAYQAEDGIYFKIASFPRYGQFRSLTGLPTDEGDFALWKFYKPEDGEVGWDASFGRGPAAAGRGRPGWHIECSAMIAATLGEQIDLHLGGTDLIFPHHENENAQSESLNGQPLARFWLHSAFMMIEGEKMAKSLGNALGLADLSTKKFPPINYRYLLLTVHYRTLLNFTWGSLTAAAKAYEKLQGLVSEWASAGPTEGQVIESYKQRFDHALEDDLNLPQALAVTWEVTKDDRVKRRDKLATLLNFDQVLGLNLTNVAKPVEIPPAVAELIKERNQARQNKDWSLADKLRAQIEALGYKVKDMSARQD